MAYDIYLGEPEDERAKVEHYMRLFFARRQERAGFESQWEEAAAICWPEYRNTFTFGNARSPGQKMTEFQLDMTGAMASHRFMSIADTMLTPAAMVWKRIVPSGPDRKYLLKQRGVKQYFHELTERLWEHTYRPEANFIGSNQQNMQALGVFGNMHMFVDELDTRFHGYEPGLRYRSMSVGQIYMLENHQGIIDGYIRHFRWTARQALQRWGEKCARQIKQADAQASQEKFDFLEFVMPRADYNPSLVLSPQGKPFTSCYVSCVDNRIMEEGGYRSFPLPSGRYMQAPEEVEGRGPAQMALPELKTLNATRSMFLEVGHQAAKGIWLVADDALIDFKAYPGSHVYGGMNADGKPLVGRAPVGELQITEEMLRMSQGAVNDAFLVTLYPALFGDAKDREFHARQVVERAGDRAMFLSPLGRQHQEYIGTMVYREVDVLSWLGVFPDMPPAVREAGGRYAVECCGPLARMMQATSVGGFLRALEVAADAAQKTGDRSPLYHFNLDEAMPAIAHIEFAPPEWMSTPQQVQAQRRAAAQQAERERQTKELPGKAAIMKAQAISDKAQAGMHTGGTLSGTPEGGMPMMPGQTEPGGRAF